MTPSEIIQCLSDDTHPQRSKAAEAAMTLGEAAAPAAAVLAAHAGDSDIGEPCIAALEDLGPPPVEAIGALAALLTADELPAYWAATLIGRLGADGAPAAKQLSQAASGVAPLAVRERAVWALGKIGPAAKETIPTLETIGQSPQPRLARLAQQAIEAIGGA